MQTIPIRQAYLDWLRIMAIFGVLVFHSAMPFVAEWGWHIKNKETSNLLLESNFWMARVRMPLLFFISGSVSWFMLQKKTAGGFIGLRFRRLFVPLLFGMLVIVPPQIYLERITQGYKGSYWDFYPSVFQFKPYPAGNTSWHHLWFILYLLVYDIICAPFFKWIVGMNGQRFLQKCSGLAKAQWIYLLILPSVILYVWLTPLFPETNDLIHDYARLPYWLLFVVVGFICISHAPFIDSLERNRRVSMAMAFIIFVVINYVRWNNLEDTDALAGWRIYAYLALYPLAAWLGIFTLIGYGKRYLNKKHRVLDYLNQAVYPFYILHQTVIIIIAFYVIRVQESILAKYLFIICLSLVVSMAVYHLCIRPFALTRFLFGMKPAPKARVEKPVEKSIEIAQPAIQIS